MVNEAMLTGESVPQMKESLCAADHKECDIVDLGPETMVHAAWKRHLVFGGTSLLLHSAAIPADQEQMRTNSATITPAPDGGCLAVVVRTGYATCQVWRCLSQPCFYLRPLSAHFSSRVV